MFQLRTSLRGSTCACVALSQVSCSIWATTNAAPSVSSTTSERHQTKASDGQRVSESGERAEVEIFTTDVGVEREGRERLRDPFARKLQRDGERVGERLAAVRERTAAAGASRRCSTTTLETTPGRGKNALGGTVSARSTRIVSAMATVRLPYCAVPGFARSRSATSFWIIATTRAGGRESAASPVSSGVATLYGRFPATRQAASSPDQAA